MIRIFYLIFTLVFAGCSTYSKNEYSPKAYTKYVNEIVKEHKKQSKEQKGLILSGDGGAFSSQVERFDLLYDSDKILSVVEARRMYVEASENLLKLINTHPKIRPYLQKYPADFDNIHIGVSFRNRTGLPGKVETIHKNECDKTIEYIQWITPFKPNVLHDETYQEAFRIVKCENLEQK